MNSIPSPPNIYSAKALHEHFKLENEKLDRERKVQNSILSMNDHQQKTNNFLKQSHDLQDLHIKIQNDNAVSSKKSNAIQLWLSIYVVTITTLSFVIQLYQAFYAQK